MGLKAAGLLLGLVVIAALMGRSYSDRYVPAIADWYTGMVIRTSSGEAMRFRADSDTDRAFYVCARSVVRRLGGDASIVTFVDSERIATQPLGEGRYRVESLIEESFGQGLRQRHVFSCLVREDGDQWVVEDLNVRPLDPAPTEVASR